MGEAGSYTRAKTEGYKTQEEEAQAHKQSTAVLTAAVG